MEELSFVVVVDDAAADAAVLIFNIFFDGEN
jgi:hypothetical protein